MTRNNVCLKEFITVLAIASFFFALTVSPAIAVNKSAVKSLCFSNIGKVHVLALNETKTLAIKVSPATASNKILQWISSNSKIVSVSSKGVIKAKKKGSAIITAVSKSNPRLKVSVKVIVGVKVESVVVSPKVDILVLGKRTKKKLSLTAYPVKASFKDVKWSSSNPKIAEVTKTGLVVAKKNGKVDITASAKDGSGKRSRKRVVVGYPVTKLTITGNSFVGLAGTETDLKANLSPSSASNKTITWKSANSKIAVVSQSGKVSGKALGKTLITATANDGSGKTASFSINVVVPSQSLTGFLAHRGLSSIEPENTLPSFKKAIDAGFYGVECDIWELKSFDETSAPKFAVMHDRNLLKMCGEDVLITSLTATEVPQFRVTKGKGISKYPEGLDIPMLEDYLDLFATTEAIPVIDIKTPSKTKEDAVKREGAIEILRLVYERGLENDIFFLSSNPYTIESIIEASKEYYPGISPKCNIVVSNSVDVAEYKLKEYAGKGFSGISIHSSLVKSGSIFSQAKTNNLFVDVWTVDDTTYSYWLIDRFRPSTITTNSMIFSL